MSSATHIHVRPLEIGDFKFVQDLASRQPHFTVPPTYVLWLMLRIRGAICLVAEHSGKGPVAYLLAVPVESPKDAMFVWQLASEFRQRESAILALLTEFQNMLVALAVDSIVFSSVPNSPAYRLIRRYAWKFLSSVPTALEALPSSIGRLETQFLLSLGNKPRPRGIH